jgi:hypothetical protein
MAITTHVPLEWRLITPADSDFTDSTGAKQYGMGVWVTGSGTLKVTYGSGRVDTIAATALVAGTQYEMQIKRVWSTGTTATGIRVAFDKK